ncbi:MAG: hypothetical protein ACYCW6_10080 [Candidatus Xenobia bacterium]
MMLLIVLLCLGPALAAPKPHLALVLLSNHADDKQTYAMLTTHAALRDLKRQHAPGSNLGTLEYSVDVPNELRFCQHLGLKAEDTALVALVEMHGRVPVRVVAEQTHLQDNPDQIEDQLRALLARAR